MQSGDFQLRENIQIIAIVIVVAVALAGAHSGTGAGKPIDRGRSRLTVRVYKTGLFSAFAHDHEISAPVESGSLNEATKSIEFTVDSRSLHVLDRKASESERAEIQSSMQGPKVLNSEKYPQIRFQSTSIGEAGDRKLIVHGDLTLHGQTHSVKVEVVGTEGHYSGSALLSQKDFGITPISLGGGSIRVKDEVRVEFEIFTQ